MNAIRPPSRRRTAIRCANKPPLVLIIKFETPLRRLNNLSASAVITIWFPGVDTQRMRENAYAPPNLIQRIQRVFPAVRILIIPRSARMATAARASRVTNIRISGRRVARAAFIAAIACIAFSALFIFNNSGTAGLEPALAGAKDQRFTD